MARHATSVVEARVRDVLLGLALSKCGLTGRFGGRRLKAYARIRGSGQIEPRQGLPSWWPSAPTKRANASTPIRQLLRRRERTGAF